MDDFKQKSTLIFEKITKVGREWLLKMINMADHTISKTTIFLSEKLKQWNDYLEDRETLLQAIQSSEEKIKKLNIDIATIESNGKDKVLRLYDKLDERTRDLVKQQQHFLKVEKDIQIAHETISTLTTERELLNNERNQLKTEYDHLQMIVKDSLNKVEKWRHEVSLLKEKQSKQPTNSPEYEKYKQQIEEYEKQITTLLEENHAYHERLQKLEKLILNKMSAATELNKQLLAAQNELAENEKKIVEIRQLLEEKSIELNKEHERSAQLKTELAENEKYVEKMKLDLDYSIEQVAQWELHLANREKEFQSKLDAETNTYKEELEKARNELAIAAVENGSPAHIPEEHLRILEQEYEPRFKTLYRDCHFETEFYRDFFTLVPSDRLRVEACIVNLNYNYEQSMSKVRKNPVKTGTNMTLNEYPFGSDSAGRIYFRKQHGKVQFYRLSRTKNGSGHLSQKNVIAWLKKKK